MPLQQSTDMKFQDLQLAVHPVGISDIEPVTENMITEEKYAQGQQQCHSQSVAPSPAGFRLRALPALHRNRLRRAEPGIVYWHRAVSHRAIGRRRAAGGGRRFSAD